MREKGKKVRWKERKKERVRIRVVKGAGERG